MARKKQLPLWRAIQPFQPEETVTLNLTGEQASTLYLLIEQPHLLRYRATDWCEHFEKTWASIGHYLGTMAYREGPRLAALEDDKRCSSDEDQLPW